MSNKIKGFIFKNKYISILVFIIIIILAFLVQRKDDLSFKDRSLEGVEVVTDSQSRTDEVEELPTLSDDELAVLKEIYEAMDKGLFEIPATIIISNSQVLENLYINILKDKAHIFDGENILKLSDAGNGKYLLIDDISTFYYGYIEDSLPNGEGNIINAYEADYNRYNYALGTWSDGKLNGEGETGSAAFGEFPENTTTLYAIRGYFKDDILNGEIQLAITDEKGQTSTYTLNSDNGISVIDENLVHNVAMSRYELSSLEDESKKYSLKDSEISDEKWINKVIFK